MYFTARSYELRYAENHIFLRINFNGQKKVTQELIEGDFNLSSPRAFGENEMLTLKYPQVQGSQVSNLNYLFT